MNGASNDMTDSNDSIFEDTPWLDPDATPLLQIQGLSKIYSGRAAVDNV